MTRFSPSRTHVARCLAVAVLAVVAALATGPSGWAPSIAQAFQIGPDQQGAPSASPQASSPRPRVGIQVGHWKNDELPAELSSLKGSTGAEGKGWREVDVNLDIAQRVEAILRQASVDVDLIPATVPPNYKADAFIALHCDANNDTTLTGQKIARASWSAIPGKDDALLANLAASYGAETGLPYHNKTITQAMRMYYAFNHSLQHSVAPSTPAVILEMGFLTTASDRQLLTGQPDRIADGIAGGILKFLNR